MISFVVAMDQNRVIGKDNDIPWHLPEDLKFFKRVTMGHPIVMGRKTYESIGKPLPGRENIIVTRNKDYEAEGCIILHSIDELKKWIDENKPEEVSIIGGAQLFKDTFPIADRLYITEIHHEVEGGDTFFPEFPESEWTLTSKEKGIKDEKNPYDYYFTVYDRK